MGNVTNRAPNTNSIRVEDFECVCLVGKGAFGKVWKVRKKDNNQIYAMKILKKAQVLEQNLVEHTVLEKEIMGSFGAHPFIVNLFYSFQTENKLYFVLDYLSGGSLFHHLSTRDDPFPEPVAAFYAAEVILGLETLHHHDIVYRDLKLENILLDSEGHIKLTDFGLSAKLEKDQLIHSFSGTALYLAPEILTDNGQGHGKSVDFWSLGVLIHVMLTQEPPFWSDNNKALFNLIIRQELELDQKGLSSHSVSLLTGLLTREVNRRLGCGEGGFELLKSHSFFRQLSFPLLIQKKVDPPIRPDSNEVLESLEVEEESIYAPSAKRDPLLAKHDNLFDTFSFTSDLCQPSPSNSSPSSPVSIPANRERKESWVPDKNARACSDCGSEFTTLRRRHHCRLCGRIFCGTCSSRRLNLGGGIGPGERVCESCFRKKKMFPPPAVSNPVEISRSSSPPVPHMSADPDYSLRKSSITPPPVNGKLTPPPPPPRQNPAAKNSET